MAQEKTDAALLDAERGEQDRSLDFNAIKLEIANGGKKAAEGDHRINNFTVDLLLLRDAIPERRVHSVGAYRTVNPENSAFSEQKVPVWRLLNYYPKLEGKARLLD
ncbi:unnamed protein product [Bemisia tabaci]|uniref:Uncharacterized protein n=1 Tax=Bemisia tabaci TaxID=7038 RepID=A0A9P0AAV7_BEMTA|nr:unnamed protein product [Bemisia tabaci]